MMTSELTPTLQRLMDARLDNVERALMTNGTQRSDRRQILAAIEDQIVELLSRIEGDQPTRADLLRILASLDPPEAYLDCSEFCDEDSSVRNTLPRTISGIAIQSTETNRLALVSFIITCVSCFFGLFWWIIAYFGLIFAGGVASAATICGIISVCQIVQSKHRQKGLWMGIVACCSIVITGFLAMLTLLIITGGDF